MDRYDTPGNGGRLPDRDTLWDEQLLISIQYTVKIDMSVNSKHITKNRKNSGMKVWGRGRGGKGGDRRLSR